MENNPYQKRLDSLAKSERFQEALELVKSVGRDFPERDFQLSKDLADLHRRSGDLGKCLDVW